MSKIERVYAGSGADDDMDSLITTLFKRYQTTVRTIMHEQHSNKKDSQNSYHSNPFKPFFYIFLSDFSSFNHYFI